MASSSENTRITRCVRCGIQVSAPVLTDSAAGLNNVPVTCNACAERLDTEWKEKELMEKIGIQRSRYIELGVLQPETLRCTFDSSNPAAEEENVGVWRRLRVPEVLATNHFLFGPTGVGKTYAARCVLNATMARGKTAAEMSARRFLLLASQYGKEAQLRALHRADVLLLDDIDKADFGRRDTLQALWELFDQRQSQCTIITANVAPKDLKVILQRFAGENSSLVDATLERFGARCQYERFSGANLRKQLQAVEA